MYQTNTAFRLPNTFILDRNRERNAVFYGHVSTEHEAQLAALENQMQRYDDQARYHPSSITLRPRLLAYASVYALPPVLLVQYATQTEL